MTIIHPPPMPPPEIVAKGGQDIDGSWGQGKTFNREFYFELVNVPVPLFMISPFIPAYNSLHPLYPFAVAKESRCTKNIETTIGRAITITTTYQILKHNVPLMGLSGFDVEAVIMGNMPFNLPAQDVSFEPVIVEEALHYVYRYHPIPGWHAVPFQTSAGTRLTGTRTRNILKMSFWYFANPMWFDEANFVTRFTGVVNAFPAMIAGRFCPAGTVKIESLEVVDNTWERPGAEPYALKMVQVVLLIDGRTWNKQYENVSSLFMAYPYLWDNSGTGKRDTKMRLNPMTQQPLYDLNAKNISPQRIFCTMYDPEPDNEGTVNDPIWTQDPHYAIQFFGTREDCFRLNPDSEPTEVSEPMYLDENGFVLYPHPDTGKVDTFLSPKVEGFTFEPVNFVPLHFPPT